MEYNKNLLPITDACFNITEACNCICEYCFTEHHPNYMTLDVAKEAATWLYNNAKISSQIQEKEIIPNIGFFGGEPTLMWDSIIVPLVNWIKERQWKFEYGITSNCVLMDKEKVDFLIENNIGLLISMDGDKTTQDMNRPLKNSTQSSFDLVSKNLSYIVEKMPGTMFRSTITAKSAPYFFENLMYAGRMGFNTVFSIINEFEEWPEEARNILEQELDKYCLYVIDACIKQENFVKLRTFEQAINKIIAIDTYLATLEDDEEVLTDLGPREMDRCGLGSGYGSINYKGEIFSCQEVASRQGEKSIFYIGNIYDGIDFEKISKLRSSFLEREIKYYNSLDKKKCENCFSKMSCRANMCPVNNYILFQDFSINADAWCWWMNMIMKKAMTVMFILGQQENVFFKNYLLQEITMPGGPFYVNE